MAADKSGLAKAELSPSGGLKMKIRLEKPQSDAPTCTSNEWVTETRGIGIGKLVLKRKNGSSSATPSPDVKHCKIIKKPAPGTRNILKLSFVPLPTEGTSVTEIKNCNMYEPVNPVAEDVASASEMSPACHLQPSPKDSGIDISSPPRDDGHLTVGGDLQDETRSILSCDAVANVMLGNDPGIACIQNTDILSTVHSGDQNDFYNVLKWDSTKVQSTLRTKAERSAEAMQLSNRPITVGDRSCQKMLKARNVAKQTSSSWTSSVKQKNAEPAVEESTTSRSTTLSYSETTKPVERVVLRFKQDRDKKVKIVDEIEQNSKKIVKSEPKTLTKLKFKCYSQEEVSVDKQQYCIELLEEKSSQQEMTLLSSKDGRKTRMPNGTSKVKLSRTTGSSSSSKKKVTDVVEMKRNSVDCQQSVFAPNTDDEHLVVKSLTEMFVSSFVSASAVNSTEPAKCIEVRDPVSGDDVHTELPLNQEENSNDQFDNLKIMSADATVANELMKSDIGALCISSDNRLVSGSLKKKSTKYGKTVDKAVECCSSIAVRDEPLTNNTAVQLSPHFACLAENDMNVLHLQHCDPGGTNCNEYENSFCVGSDKMKKDLETCCNDTSLHNLTNHCIPSSSCSSSDLLQSETRTVASEALFDQTCRENHAVLTTLSVEPKYSSSSQYSSNCDSSVFPAHVALSVDQVELLGSEPMSSNMSVFTPSDAQSCNDHVDRFYKGQSQTNYSEAQNDTTKFQAAKPPVGGSSFITEFAKFINTSCDSQSVQEMDEDKNYGLLPSDDSQLSTLTCSDKQLILCEGLNSENHCPPVDSKLNRNTCRRRKLTHGGRLHVKPCSSCSSLRRRRTVPLKRIDVACCSSGDRRLISLRHKVCDLLDVVFPSLVYPKNFRKDSTSVERFLDQIMQVLNSNEIRTARSSSQCSEPYVDICCSPDSCADNLRWKIVQLITALLPEIELPDIADDETAEVFLELLTSANRPISTANTTCQYPASSDVADPCHDSPVSSALLSLLPGACFPFTSKFPLNECERFNVPIGPPLLFGTAASNSSPLLDKKSIKRQVKDCLLFLDKDLT